MASWTPCGRARGDEEGALKMELEQQAMAWDKAPPVSICGRGVYLHPEAGWKLRLRVRELIGPAPGAAGQRRTISVFALIIFNILIEQRQAGFCPAGQQNSQCSRFMKGTKQRARSLSYRFLKWRAPKTCASVPTASAVPQGRSEATATLAGERTSHGFAAHNDGGSEQKKNPNRFKQRI